MSTVRNKVKSIRGIEPGDEVLVHEREAIFLGEWDGKAWFMYDDEEDRTRWWFEGHFREQITFGGVEKL